MYDGVLRIRLVGEARSIAYADDLALLVQAKKDTHLQGAMNANLQRINRWMVERGLKLAPQKSEAIILRGPRKRDHIKIHIDGVEIPTKRAIKYLGVHLDDLGTFGPHVLAAVRKADTRIQALRQLMANIHGPNSLKRALLCGVATNDFLYAAPIWADALRIHRYKEMLRRTHRKALLRVASA